MRSVAFVPPLSVEYDPAPDGPADLSAFLPLVKSIACRIYARIPSYAAIELRDLIQSGHLGLVNASRTYLSSRRVPFAAYARFRIRGEILDSLRQVDLASRGMRRLDRRVKAAVMELSADLKRDPTQSELNQKLRQDPRLGGGEREVRYLKVPPITITSLDDRDAEQVPGPGGSFHPESIRSAAEARQILNDAISCLPRRSKELILLYYHADLTLREIGEKFHVNESRVSQIHRRALESMAHHLRSIGVFSLGDV